MVCWFVDDSLLELSEPTGPGVVNEGLGGGFLFGGGTRSVWICGYPLVAKGVVGIGVVEVEGVKAGLGGEGVK